VRKREVECFHEGSFGKAMNLHVLVADIATGRQRKLTPSFPRDAEPRLLYERSPPPR